ncbi:RNA polymerase sigma factor [Phenylobacterium sp.]|uniref:RNA polymerase sigma factor n=1 Tax=Phenylobacterium sp. TaxID=1871053 RepID=UPI002BAE765E|nr:RNA polymerase sigma factor [Phenylobacterium sp.]HVI31609.1 RNA polymerase sigma factor [Phenylobacterium sp.]
MTGLKPEQAPSVSESGSLSLELLYRRHFNWLMRAVRHRFGRDQAEDLVQETYARVAASQGVAVRNPKAFLMQVATRVAIDQERRRAVRSNVSMTSCGTPDVVDEAAQAELLLLKQVILGLPVQLRETFLLSRGAGLTYEEIAAREGVALKTIEWRMSKALKLCAKALATQDGF